MKRPVLLIIFSFAFVLPGCSKDNESAACICPAIFDPVCGENGKAYGNACEARCDEVNFTTGKCPVEAEGLVKNAGDAMADGCGFILEIGKRDHHPINLQNDFATDSLEVKVRYWQLNSRFSCGLVPNNLPEIDIISIQLK